MFIGGIQYNDRDIARMLMSRLWRIYDHGGISMGRHIRSALLDAVLDLDVFPKVFGEVDDVLGDVLKDSSLPREFLPYQQVLFSEVEFLPDNELIRLAFVQLQLWYELDFEWRSSAENRIVSAICNLLGIRAFEEHTFSIFVAIEVVGECKQRYRESLPRMKRMDEFQDWVGF